MFTPVINFRTIVLVTDSYFDPYLIFLGNVRAYLSEAPRGTPL